MQASTTPGVIVDEWNAALRLRLHAPASRNAVTLGMAQRIRQCLQEQPDSIVVLGSAEPGVFSSGADIKVDDGTRRAISEELYECYRLMVTRPGPVLAVVEGAAVGGGAQLATAADLRIAGPGARWRWTGPGHGLAVGAWILPALVGRGRALELMMSGRWLDATEAVEAGLVGRIEADPWQAAAAMVRGLAELDQLAVSHIKQVSLEPGILAALECEHRVNRSWDGRAPAGRPASPHPTARPASPQPQPAGPAAWSWEAWSRDSWRRHLGDRPVPAPVPGGETLAGAAWQMAARFPAKLAVSIDGHGLTFTELTDGAARAAGWLQGSTRKGDRLLLAAPTSPAWVELYLGALAAGRVVVLANPSSTAAELSYLISDSEAGLVAAGGPAVERAGGLGVPVVDVAARPWAGAAPIDGPLESLVAGDTAILAYTSGTTGRPKGVPLSHAQLVSSILGALESWRWSPDDVVVHGMPLYHQHGLGALHATFCTGSSAGILSHFDEAAIASEARRLGATVMFGVPAIYRRLVDRVGDLPSGDAAALRNLRLRICGSAPLDEVLAAEMADRLGTPVLVRYGLTESGLDVSQPFDQPRPGTIGIPLPGVELRLVSDGVTVDPGREGEIQLRGPQVFAGYWRDAEATAGATTADGWFKTGDIAVLDSPDGHLVIRGRSKELIITGGLNVYPREVELALESHPAVQEAAVAGVPDPKWGEQVTAWVVRAPGAGDDRAALADTSGDGDDRAALADTSGDGADQAALADTSGDGADQAALADTPGGAVDEAALLAHARSLLAAYKCPKKLYFVESLPRTPMGKIQRSKLHPPGDRPGAGEGRQ